MTLFRLFVTSPKGREYTTTAVVSSAEAAAALGWEEGGGDCDIVLAAEYVRPAPRCEALDGRFVALRVAPDDGSFDCARAVRKYDGFARFLLAASSRSGSKAALVRGLVASGGELTPTASECHVIARLAPGSADQVELVLTYAASPIAAAAAPLPAAVPAAAPAPAAAAPPRSRYAAVFLVMKGDNYVPGALVAGHSWKRSGSRAETLCMVTADVSAGARVALRVVFDHVREVPYIRARHKPLRTTKQRKYYEKWVGEAFTKWNMLLFEEYEKVLFIDADKLIVSNMDELFELRAPAGTFSMPWSEPWKPNGIRNPYYRHFSRLGLGGEATHGQPIPRAVVREGLESAFVLIGTCVLLAPSRDGLARFKRMLAEHGGDDGDAAAGGGGGSGGSGGAASASSSASSSSAAAVARPRTAAFGFDRCNSMMDEQSIAHFLNDCCPEVGDERSAWTMIHQRFNLIPWHPKWLREGSGQRGGHGGGYGAQQQRKRGRADDASAVEAAASAIATPTLFHYFNVNPWQMKRKKYKDLESWWFVAKRLADRHPELGVWFDADDLAAPLAPPGACFWCEAVFGKHNAAHSGCKGVWAADGTLGCPLLRGELGRGGASGASEGSKRGEKRLRGHDGGRRR